MRNYFPTIKFLCLAAVSFSTLLDGQTGTLQSGLQVCLIAFVLFFSTLYELFVKIQPVMLVLEGIMIFAVLGIMPAEGLYLLPFWTLDIIVFMKLGPIFFLVPMIGCFYPKADRFSYFYFCLLIGIIYLQHHILLKQYQDRVKADERKEFELKDTIHQNEGRLREELLEKGIYFENRMLEDRAKLSQALHDKLGHSINGSIYQLEACKVLMEKDQKKSGVMIQNVIDSLRVSMDEIRTILRKEKPEKKKAALLQLYSLCEECREKYGIEMEFVINGNTDKITDEIWEAVLDNTFEAVTNALKYAGCTNIKVLLYVMNKLIRLMISDNGKGCSELKAGMGIEGMKSRVRKLNGTIDFETVDGFTVNMILPIGGQTKEVR